MPEAPRILCPIDFSEGSRAAIRAALQQARATSAAIILLHVDELPAYAYLSADLLLVPEILAAVAADADEKLAAVRKQVEEAGVPVETAHTTGVPHEAIVQFARERGCALIVLATHGRTGLRHVLIGSVAERVVRHADCPVLTVRPPGVKFSPP